MRWSGLIFCTILVIGISTSEVAALDCPFVMPEDGQVVVLLWYRHQEDLKPLVWNGRLYTTLEMETVEGGSTLNILESQGHPIGVQWQIDGETWKTCGTRPPLVFQDDFELDGLFRWSTTQGGSE